MSSKRFRDLLEKYNARNGLDTVPTAGMEETARLAVDGHNALVQPEGDGHSEGPDRPPAGPGAETMMSNRDIAEAALMAALPEVPLLKGARAVVGAGRKALTEAALGAGKAVERELPALAEQIAAKGTANASRSAIAGPTRFTVHAPQSATVEGAVYDATNSKVPRIAELLEAGISPAQVNDKGKIILQNFLDSPGAAKAAARSASHNAETGAVKASGAVDMTPEFDSVLARARKALSGSGEKAPVLPMEGKAAAAVEGQVAPGEASYLGKSAQQRNDENKELLRKYFEAKGEKFAAGGVVPEPTQQPSGSDIDFSPIADQLHVKYFNAGGVAGPDRSPREPSDVDDEFTPQFNADFSQVGMPQPSVLPPGKPVYAPPFPAMTGPGTGAPVPRIIGVNTAPVAITEQIPHPELVAPPVPGSSPVPQPAEQAHPAEQARLDAGASAEAAKYTPPTENLESMEAARRAALEDAQPGTGTRIGQAIAAGLLGFAGRPQIDFAAAHRANTSAINSEFDRREKAYVGAPGAEAQRSASVTDSPLSGRVRNMLGTISGRPEIVEGMSAAEVQTFGMPLYEAFLKGQMTRDQLGMKLAELAETRSHHAAQADRDERKLVVDQQNADANMLRAQKAGAEMANSNETEYFKAAEGVREHPQARQALNDITAAQKLEPILDKARKGQPISDVEATLAAEELAKMASGSVGNVHLTAELKPLTAEARVAKIKQMLTGNMGDAGYGPLIKGIYTPYVEHLKKNAENVIKKVQSDTLKTRAHRLSPEFAAQQARLRGLNPDFSVPEEPKAPEPEDPAAKYGGRTVRVVP